MKNAFFSLLLLSIAFVSCKKEVTFDDQLAGKWTSTNVKVGSTDVTSTNSLIINIESTHEFDADIITRPLIGTAVTSSYTGTWTADEVKQELYLKYDTGEKETYDITEVNETTLKASTIISNVRREFVFEKTGN